MTLYVCDNCGQVRATDNDCVACGASAATAYEEDGDAGYECHCGESFDSEASLRGHKASAHSG